MGCPMWGKQELKRAFPEPFVTKGLVKERLMLKKYDYIRPFFDGLEPMPGTRIYLTEDFINNVISLKNK